MKVSINCKESLTIDLCHTPPNLGTFLDFHVTQANQFQDVCHFESAKSEVFLHPPAFPVGLIGVEIVHENEAKIYASRRVAHLPSVF